MAEHHPFTCPSCGNHDLPDSHRRAKAEFEALGDKARKVARELIVTLHLDGYPEKRAWTNCLWDCLRELVPSFPAAHRIGEPVYTMGIMDDEEGES